MEYVMNQDHSVNMDQTYRNVIAGARVSVEMAARDAPAQTRNAVSEIFNNFAEVFNVLEAARNQAANVALQNPDLNDEAIERKYRPIVAKAVADANAARNAAASGIDKLERDLQAATMPKMPAGNDLQMQLLNMKNDLKMLFDSIHEASLLDALIGELEGRIRAVDEVGIYLLGADRWPVLYLQSRGAHSEAVAYQMRAAAALKPLQAVEVQVQADVLRCVNIGGREGLRSILVNIDGYLNRAIPELEATNAHSWSTDAFHRY